ncbi:DUF1499 domain-containing protein [uncultured Desulfobacter sp.]|uniref:DUF1499 domain-containing protein n=1 Tax=uncultured Desulfobacter sp. TaxID=240139 RepID=UPI002AAB7353|nr:DUF1499 domain-containing protein [uncultured Desulfobacter sp.]
MSKQTLIVLASLFFITGCMTTMPNLGIENGKLKECPDSPNCVNSQIQKKNHFIEPITLKATSLEAKNYILEVLKNFKQSKVVVVENNYIRAEFVSKVFRFVDDVEFYFPDSDSAEILIHVRSASRVGYSDLGVNRKRIENIRSKIHEIIRK